MKRVWVCILSLFLLFCAGFSVRAADTAAVAAARDDLKEDERKKPVLRKDNFKTRRFLLEK